MSSRKRRQISKKRLQDVQRARIEWNVTRRVYNRQPHSYSEFWPYVALTSLMKSKTSKASYALLSYNLDYEAN